MTYQVHMPDGSPVDVPDDMPIEVATQHLMRQFPDQFPDRQSGFMPAMKAGFNQGIGDIEQFGGNLAAKAGLPGVADYLTQRGTANKDVPTSAFMPTTQEDTDAAFKQGIIPGIKSFITQHGTEALGDMAGRYGPSIAAGVVAAPVAATLGLGAGAAGLAGTAAMMLPATAMESNANLERQHQQGQPEDMGSAVGAGLVQAAMMKFGLGKFISGAAGSQLALREAQKLVPDVLSGAITKEAAAAQLGGTLRNMATETGANFATNAGMMAGSEALRRAQAGQDIASPDALTGYADTLKTAGVLAPLFGGLHGATARGKAVGVIDAANQKVVDFKGAMQSQKSQEQALADQKVQEAADQAAQAEALGKAQAQQDAVQRTQGLNTDIGTNPVEFGTQPGVMDPSRPLQMQPQVPDRRAMAQDAFTQAEPDIYGNVHPAQETAPVDQTRRASDQPPTDFALQPEPPQQSLNFNPTDQRAPVPEAPTNAAPPAVTTPLTFADMVYPRSKLWTSGDLVGKDLNDPVQVQGLITALKKYNYSVEDNEANAPRKQAMQSTINDYTNRLATLKSDTPAPGELPGMPPANARYMQAEQEARAVQPVEALPALDGPAPTVTRAADFKNNGTYNIDIGGSTHQIFRDPASGQWFRRDPSQTSSRNALRSTQKEAVAELVNQEIQNVDRQTSGVSSEPVNGAGQPDMGLRDQPPAVAGRLSGADGRQLGNRDGAAGADVGRAPGDGDALTAPERPMPEQLPPAAATDAATKQLAAPEPAAAFSGPMEPPTLKPAADFKESGSYDTTLNGEPRRVYRDATDKQWYLEGKDGEASDHAIGNTKAEALSNLADMHDFAPADSMGQLHPTTADAVMRGGKLNDVLDTIAKNGSSPENKALAQRLRDVGMDTTIEPGKISAGVGDARPGVHEASKNRITLDPTTASEHTVLHESVHAATVWAFDHQAKLTPDQRAAVQTIRGLFNDLKSKGKLADEYGLTNVKEFVAEAQSNPAFQQALRGTRGLWDRFVGAVKKLLGLKDSDTLAKVLNASNQIMQNSRKSEGGASFAPAAEPFADFPKVPVRRGLIESAVHGTKAGADAVKNRPDPATLWKKARLALSEGAKTVEQRLFDQKMGITRYLPRTALETLDGRQQMSITAALQHAEYGIPLANDSLHVGGVEKNSEGMFHVVKSDANFVNLNKAIYAMPDAVGTGKMQAFNGLMANLQYSERDAQRQARIDAAPAKIAKARANMALAQTMEPKMRAKVMRTANKALELAQADKHLEKLARPEYITDESMATAQALLKAHPEVQAVADMVKAINQQNIKTLLEGQKISQDTADLWSKNEHYVNMQRMMDEDLGGGSHYNGGRGGAATPEVKQFKGSIRDVKDIYDNLIQQRLYVVDSAMRNDAFQRAAERLAAQSDGGVERVEALPPNTRNGITVFEKGEKTFYRVSDPNTFKSFSGLTEAAPAFMDKLELATKVLREGVMLAPPAMLRNVVRDVADTHAFSYTDRNIAHTTANVAKHMAAALPKMVKDLRSGKQHAFDYDVVRYGVSGTREHTSLMAEKEKYIRDAMRSAGGKEDWGAGLDRATSAIWHAWQDVAMEVEISTRESMFQDALKRTGSPTEAAMAAINTMDFRRRGDATSVTYMKKLVPFFNSQLQGYYKIYRALVTNDAMGMSKADARKALIKKAMYTAIAASAYQAVMQQDPNYVQASKQDADNNILLPMGGGVFVKAALPFEFGAAAVTGPMNMVRYMTGDQSGRETINAMLAALGHQAPSIAPQIAKPAVEAYLNRSSFTGKAIESDPMMKLAPAERKNGNTSEVAKKISAGLGGSISPIKTDYLLDNYFGSLGQFATGMVDQMLGAAGLAPDVANAPETPVSRLPGLKGVTTDPLHSRAVDRFYELNGMTDQVVATANKMIGEGRIEDVKKYLHDTGPTGVPNSTLFSLNDATSATAKVLANNRKMLKQITSMNISPADKRRRIEFITKQSNAYVEKQLPTLQKAAGDN